VPPAQSNLAASPIQRDKQCKISATQDYLEAAHRCPRSELEWFNSNAMDKYNLNRNLGGTHLMKIPPTIL